MADLFLLEDQIHDADDAECAVCAAGDDLEEGAA